MGLLQLVLSRPLGPLSLMASESNCKYGIQLVKSGSELLQLLITVEPWVFCLYMTLLTSLLLTTLGIGFVILSSMLLTMLTKYWWATRLTWMKVKGLCQLLKVKHLQMNMVSSFLRLVQKQI